MEAKRKMEEFERKRQEDEDLRAAVALQVIYFTKYEISFQNSFI